MKVCSCCRMPKAPSKFHGGMATCSQCRARNKRWRRVAINHRRVMDAIYYKKNRDKIHIRGCKWREKNAERLRLYRIKHKNRLRRNRRLHYLNNRHLYIANSRNRIAIQLHVMPTWVDCGKISAIYAKCAKITKATGVLHHVDHKIPLRGRRVCGLHVHQNLRIVPAKDNLAKSNKF